MSMRKRNYWTAPGMDYSDPENLLLKICELTDTDVDSVKSKSKKAETTTVRQLYCWAAKALTKKTLLEIGKVVNIKQHATVIHAIKAINQGVEIGDALISKKMEKIKCILPKEESKKPAIVGENYACKMIYVKGCSIKIPELPKLKDVPQPNENILKNILK